MSTVTTEQLYALALDIYRDLGELNDSMDELLHLVRQVRKELSESFLPYVTAPSVSMEVQ